MAKRVSLKGKGADLFFGDYPSVPDGEAVAAPTPLGSHPPEPAPTTAPPQQSVTPSESRTDGTTSALAAPAAGRKPPSKPSRSRPQASGVASTLASTLADTDARTIEAIRQVIKMPGREVSFVRLTPEEKAQLGDIVYTYKRQGRKTSETEINRIAINYLLLDYHEHGEQSVLARVLAALFA